MFKKHVYFFRRRQQLAGAPSDTWVAGAVTAERDVPVNARAIHKVAVGHDSAVLRAGESPARVQAAAGAVPKPRGPPACAFTQPLWEGRQKGRANAQRLWEDGWPAMADRRC